MGKIKERVTILAVGDNADYDSYKKLNREKKFILKSGFDYHTMNYKKLLKSGIPKIETKKIIIFLFFPFYYWNDYIEHKNYAGIYGNRSFYEKFMDFWNSVNNMIRNSLIDKEAFFVMHPSLCGLYRDKMLVARKFKKTGISSPKIYSISRIKEMKRLLNKGESFFVKPQFGSMGKGITFLNWSNWQTNFTFKNNRIISRRSDKGWKFREITGNTKFLSQLIKGDVVIEKAIDSILVKKNKIDMRIYVFFNKVIYVYPRRNKVDKLTTNISQGAKGDPSVLNKLPKHLVEKAKKLAEKVSKSLNLNLVGMDIMIDRNLNDVYVIDVNLFPGFPKIRTFNLSQYMVKELKGIKNRGKLKFEKI